MTIASIIAGAKTAARLLPYAGMTVALLFAGIKWADATHWNKRFNAEQAAHKTTKSEYRLAQALAGIAARDAATQERNRFDALTMKVIQTHENRSAANAGAIANLLRNEAARRAPSQTDLPGNTGLSSGPLQPAAPTFLSDNAVVSADDLIKIGGAYAQCDSLIDWARGLGEVK